MTELIKDSAVLYYSWHEALAAADDATYRRCMTILMDYCCKGIQPQLDAGTYMWWCMAKPVADRNMKAYEAGKRGGRPRKQAETAEQQTQQTQQTQHAEQPMPMYQPQQVQPQMYQQVQPAAVNPMATADGGAIDFSPLSEEALAAELPF